MPLPIENDPSILTEYGRAFAYINSVELFLYEIIKFRGDLYRANGKLVQKLIERKTLGELVGLAETFIENNELIEKLKQLNKDRVQISHGATAEEVDIKNTQAKTGKFVIVKKDHTSADLNIDILKKIVINAESISALLHKEITKNIKN